MSSVPQRRDYSQGLYRIRCRPLKVSTTIPTRHKPNNLKGETRMLVQAHMLSPHMHLDEERSENICFNWLFTAELGTAD